MSFRLIMFQCTYHWVIARLLIKETIIPICLRKWNHHLTSWNFIIANWLMRNNNEDFFVCDIIYAYRDDTPAQSVPPPENHSEQDQYLISSEGARIYQHDKFRQSLHAFSGKSPKTTNLTRFKIAPKSGNSPHGNYKMLILSVLHVV